MESGNIDQRLPSLELLQVASPAKDNVGYSIPPEIFDWWDSNDDDSRIALEQQYALWRRDCWRNLVRCPPRIETGHFALALRDVKDNLSKINMIRTAHNCLIALRLSLTPPDQLSRENELSKMIDSIISDSPLIDFNTANSLNEALREMIHKLKDILAELNILRQTHTMETNELHVAINKLKTGISSLKFEFINQRLVERPKTLQEASQSPTNPTPGITPSPAKPPSSFTLSPTSPNPVPMRDSPRVGQSPTKFPGSMPLSPGYSPSVPINTPSPAVQVPVSLQPQPGYPSPSASSFFMVPLQRVPEFSNPPVQHPNYITDPSQQTAGYLPNPSQQAVGFLPNPSQPSTGYLPNPPQQAAGYLPDPSQQVTGYITSYVIDQSPQAAGYISDPSPQHPRYSHDLSHDSGSIPIPQPNLGFVPSSLEETPSSGLPRGQPLICSPELQKSEPPCNLKPPHPSPSGVTRATSCHSSSRNRSDADASRPPVPNSSTNLPFQTQQLSENSSKGPNQSSSSNNLQATSSNNLQAVANRNNSGDNTASKSGFSAPVKIRKS